MQQSQQEYLCKTARQQKDTIYYSLIYWLLTICSVQNKYSAVSVPTSIQLARKKINEDISECLQCILKQRFCSVSLLHLLFLLHTGSCLLTNLISWFAHFSCNSFLLFLARGKSLATDQRLGWIRSVRVLH